MLHSNLFQQPGRHVRAGIDRPCSARPSTWLAFALTLVACLVISPRAVAQPSTSSNRFLFVVDTSAGMKPFDGALRETVFDLVYSGARGHMTNGDSFGIWTINEQNDTSFTLDVWKAKHSVESAARATWHVKERGFKGRARLDLAFADAARVVQSVEDLTLILVSNGETPVSGTPFDAEINAKFLELAPQMKRAKGTLNTVLIAQDGVFVAWAVNSPEFLIEVPYVAPKPKKPKVELAAKTNAPLPVAATSQAAPPAKARAAAANIVITKETVAQEKRTYQAMTASASTPEPLASIPATNTPAPFVATSAAPVVVALTNAAAPRASNVVVLATNLPAPAAVAPPLVVAATNPVPVSNAVVAVVKPAVTNAAALVPIATPPAAPLPAPVRAEAPAATSFRPMVWAAFGAGLALAGVLAVYFVIRSRRVEPSLISEAIAQERLNQRESSVQPPQTLPTL